MDYKFNYLDISVSMTDADGNHTVTGNLGAEAPVLPDITQLSAQFNGLREGYLLWQTPDRRAWSYFTLGTESAAQQMDVTIMGSRNLLISGRQVLNLLSSLAARVKDGESVTPQLIDRLASEAGFTEEPLEAADNTRPMDPAAKPAYRTYLSPGELTNMLGFPRQDDYADYSAIALIKASVADDSTPSISHITTPLSKALAVVLPEGVTASATSVEFSDHLTVIYSCPGFDPVSVMFEIGTTNRYVRINGPALIVNNAAHAGIIFHKRIPFTVNSGSGTPIDTFTILINDRTANRSDEGFEVANTDFRTGRAKITVSSTNFSTFTAEFTPEELAAAAPLTVVLEPEAKDILLRLDFGDGRVVEETLNIEKNTPEYCRLRAGKFHGFHAHRLMGSTPETYNVDVRPHYGPVTEEETEADIAAECQTADTDTARQSAAGPVAPLIEKAPTAIWKQKKSERRAPNFVNETDKSGSGSQSSGSGRRISWSKVVMVVITAFIAGMALWYLATLLTGSGKGDGNAAPDSTAVAAGPVAPGSQAAASPAALTADEQADVDYLNKHTKWKLAELKTDRYKALYRAIGNGEIDSMARNDYFMVEGRCTNKKANQLMDLVWASKGAYEQKSNEKRLREFKDKDEMDINKIIDRVAGVKPKEPNKEPRPVQKP